MYKYNYYTRFACSANVHTFTVIAYLHRLYYAIKYYISFIRLLLPLSTAFVGLSRGSRRLNVFLFFIWPYEWVSPKLSNANSYFLLSCDTFTFILLTLTYCIFLAASSIILLRLCFQTYNRNNCFNNSTLAILHKKWYIRSTKKTHFFVWKIIQTSKQQTILSNINKTKDLLVVQLERPPVDESIFVCYYSLNVSSFFPSSRYFIHQISESYGFARWVTTFNYETYFSICKRRVNHITIKCKQRPAGGRLNENLLR